MAAAFYAYWAWCSVLSPEQTARLILQKDLWPFIYTPNIAPAMRYENLLEKYLPEALLPLVVNIDRKFLRQIEKDERPAVQHLADRIKKAIKKRYQDLRMPGELGWSDKHLKRVVVCDSDGSRPLGEGDLGRNAGLITVGKLMCTAAVTEGAVHPALTLGILLDTGTNRQRLLKDDQYRGQKTPRIGAGNSGYQKAMAVVKKSYRRLGLGFVQDEDFAGSEAWFNIGLAREILPRYLDDDIEGTGNLMAETLLLAESLGINLSRSAIICHGTGGAGSGIKDQAKKVFGRKISGRTFDELFWFLDTAGLLTADRKVKTKQGRQEFKSFQEEMKLIIGQNDSRLSEVKEFRQKTGRNTDQPIGLVETVKMIESRLKKWPDGAIFLYGFAMSAGEFDDRLMIALAKSKRPVFMVAGSNPLEVCEIISRDDLPLLAKANTKEQKTEIIKKRLERLYRVYEKHGGKTDDLKISLGSAYVEFNKPGGKKRMASQANNLFTFGAIVWAVVEAGFDRLTDRMMAASARAGAGFMLQEEGENFSKGALYPKRSNLSAVIAAKTASMIWVGLVDRRVRAANSRWTRLGKQISGLSRKKGMERVRIELENVRKENRRRMEESIKLRKKTQSELQTAREAFRAGTAVLHDPKLIRAAKTVTAKTP